MYEAADAAGPALTPASDDKRKSRRLPLCMEAGAPMRTPQGRAACRGPQLGSLARADSAGSTVAVQLPRSFSASEEREPGSAV